MFPRTNLDNLDEFLSEPDVLVRKVLTDTKVKQDIDQQLEIIPKRNIRTVIGTLNKVFTRKL